MPSSFPRLRMLLLQVREAHKVAEHEKQCVVERCGLHGEQVHNINLVEHPNPDWRDVEQADVVVIGGAGVHSAVEDYPFTELLGDMIRRMADEAKPLFGSCWGHQFMARALGGESIHDPERSEVGARDVRLTDAGRNDPIFWLPDQREAFPSPFKALLGHRDRVATLPPGAVELACTDICPFQAFRLADRPAYGTQFHAELTEERLLERLMLYRHIYMPDDEDFEEMSRALQPTPYAAQILRRFLEEYV
ncbi:MAG: type 1 glutamine amidotransferase [Phycisphaerales bacterium]|nr:type 1 glutamine amidotransferase [Phycisphaerales bacterium]